MKLIIRLIVLIVVALFIFTGGFWLGKQWKGDREGSPDGSLLANLPGQEAAAPTPEDAKTEALKDQAPPIPTKDKVENSSDQPISPGIPEQEAAKSKQETIPPENEAALFPKKPEETLPQKTPVEPGPVEAAASKENNVAPPPETKSPPPVEAPPAPAPAGGVPMPEKEVKKESLALIVTPEDLGENQITYSVQAGTFLDKELARIQLDQLKAKQYPAFIVGAWDNQNQLWYTVRVGRYTDIMKAQMAAKEITMKERIPATVYGVGSLRYEEPQEQAGAGTRNTAPAGSNPEVKTSPPGKEESGL